MGNYAFLTLDISSRKSLHDNGDLKAEKERCHNGVINY